MRDHVVYRKVHLILSFLFCSFMLYGQQGIQADVRSFMFQTPDNGAYVEIYIGVLSQSLRSDILTGAKEVEVLEVLKSDDKILHAEKYALKSGDSDKDFYHVDRIALEPGIYEVQVSLKDLADTTRTYHRVIELDVPEVTDTLKFSSIQLLGNVHTDTTGSARAKSGLIMEPLKFSYVNNNYDQLLGYVELYNVDRTEGEHYIFKYEVIREVSSGSDTVRTRYKRRKIAEVDPILIREWNDSTWLSGKYKLAISALDYEQNVLASATTKFVINNPDALKNVENGQLTIEGSFVQDLNEEELVYALRALAPRVNPLDIERLGYLIEEGELANKRSFLFGFWAYTSPLDPELGYRSYMDLAKVVDRTYYEGLGPGFESDRGYIYLKYGAPDDIISVENESTAPPYEIWIYADFPATRQNNVKFVFYNPVATQYDLLHSNARGEINDPQWLIKLYSDSPEDVVGNPLDARGVKSYWNRRAAEIFNDN